ncbi:unnamed protein product [Prorocentrum cordatum]|uniref:C3H1-type domain-containing protein n=1 Tax=Prorocentrum cordatum TaxID=2364126 RepID=A0ABN9UAK3_9DINO|nr:unnamed protein product [Polarella glacialis]
MPGLPLSPFADVETAAHGACTLSSLWPPTPTPTAGPPSLEAHAQPSDAVRWPLLPSQAPHGKAVEQGSGLPPLDVRGRSQLQQPVKVKNTFIDGFLDDEEQGDGPAMTACKTWCVGTAATACPLQGSASWSCASTTDEESAAATAPTSPEGAVRLPEEPPHPAQLPQASAGSELHGTGRCRPCGWFWKPGGCVHGAACCHCHTCPEGELRARKKAKLAALRARSHEGSANDSQ